MGEMIQTALVLADGLYLNGQLLAVGANLQFCNPSQLCSLLSCTALPAAVGRWC